MPNLDRNHEKYSCVTVALDDTIAAPGLGCNGYWKTVGLSTEYTTMGALGLGGVPERPGCTYGRGLIPDSRIVSATERVLSTEVVTVANPPDQDTDDIDQD